MRQDKSRQVLYRHQKLVSRYLRKTNASKILSFDMRLGKTATAIKVMDGRKERVLVIVPANVIGVWQEEVERWANYTEFIVISYAKLGKVEFKNKIKELDVDAVIIDEAHRLSKYVQKSTKNFLLLFGRKKKGIQMLFLTATPIINDPREIYYMLKFTDVFKEHLSVFDRLFFDGFYNHKTRRFVRTKFKNGKELKKMIKEATIRIRYEDLKNQINLTKRTIWLDSGEMVIGSFETFSEEQKHIGVTKSRVSW